MTPPKWHSKVPKFQNLCVCCDVWTEEEHPQIGCIFEVDQNGFFIRIQRSNSENEVIEICQISDVRPGVSKDSKCLSQMNNKYCDVNPEWQKQTFTVCSGSDLVDITYHHFMCSDANTAEVWRDCILRISRDSAMNNLSAWTNLKKQWTRLQLCRDHNGNIPVKLLSKVFGSGKGDVFKVVQEMKLTSSDDPTSTIEPSAFPFDRFYELYIKLCTREDVEALFKSIAEPSSNTIDAEMFTAFLNEHRDLRLNEILFPKKERKRAQEIIQRFEVDEDAKEKNEMTLDGFLRFLLSDENPPINMDHLNVYMDMDQPLAHYFINSSHNTYLTGRQFYGKSNVEMYRQVLLAGCRCVELDCWDGEDEEPMITHGKAICTSIPFKDVIEAIRDTAFVASQYPVILSLENHCCKKQQLKMAKYCEDILKDMLLKEPLPDHPLEPGRLLPSPNALKGKILLKNKRLESNDEKEEDNSGEKEAQKEEPPSEPCSPAPPVNKGGQESTGGTGTTCEVFVFESGSQRGPQDPCDPEWSGPHCTNDDLEVNLGKDQVAPLEETTIPTIPHTSSTTNVHPYLSKMVNYAQPIKFPGFAEAQRKNIHHNMSSFSETTGLSMLNSEPTEFVNYNKRQMSRIYPRGTRLDSTNFMPQIFWSAGCQMVALNFQTADLAMQLNQGRFEYNGNCGYLLKPEPLRSHREFYLYANSPIDGIVAAQLTVKVLSGQFLSDRKIGTYVEVDMYGLPSDTIRKEFRTKIVPSNGLNPRYDDDPFCFRKVVLPELAMLRFGVYDETNRLLGQRVIPFESLHSGYHHIPLRTEGNFPMTLPTLFCHIELSVYIPDHHRGFFDALCNNSRRQKEPKEVTPKEGEEPQQRKNSDRSRSEPRAEFVQKKSLSSSQIEGIRKETMEAQYSQTMEKHGGDGSGGSGGSGKAGSSKKGSKTRSDEEKVIDFPDITVDILKKDNEQFSKLLQKQEKKLRHLEMKHSKNLEALLRSQCLANEKLNTSKRRVKPKSGVGLPDIMKDQVTKWSTLKEKQRGELLSMRENHLKVQFDKLERLMRAAQARQMKELEEVHKRSNKTLNSNQAKTSIKAIDQVRNDSNLKSHGEKERCVREIKEQMTKRFAEERRNNLHKQSSQKNMLLVGHARQIESLSKERQQAMDKITYERKEHEAYKINEFCV